MSETNQTFFTNVMKRGDNLYVRRMNMESGKREKEVIPFKPKFYIPANGDEAKYTGIRGEKLAVMDFGCMSDAQDFVDRYRDVDGFRVFGQKDFGFQYLAEAYPQEHLAYDATKIRKFIKDIEVFSGSIDENGDPVSGPFPEPEEALFPINAVCIHDSYTDTFYLFGLEVFNGHYLGTYKHDPNHPKVGKLKVVYQGFNSEDKLLRAVIDLWAEMEPDAHSGWNTETFDTPYFGNRVRLILDQKELNRMSPWGHVKARKFKGKFGREETTFDITGVANLDYKQLCEKHGFFEPDDWKLDTVANHLLGDNKISYEEAGSLNTLYVTDYQGFLEYNIHDVNLVKRIDEKKKLFALVFALAYLMRANYEDTLATVRPWSSFAYFDLLKHGVQPEIHHAYNGDIEFVGGFVKEPVPGRRKWIVSVDFASLNNIGA